MAESESRREGVILNPGEGRKYDMGTMTAIFKADRAESAGGYNISEWWLEPNSKGPPAHSHPEDDVFFVIEGTLHFLMGEKWHEAPKGGFVLVPGGVQHTFENRGGVRAGALNFGVPAGFEENMPGIVDWFSKNPKATLR